MKGISSINGDIQATNDIQIVENSELLLQELNNFLNIRCAHIVDNKTIDTGECFWDQNFGIDYVLIFETNDDDFIKNHIKNKIMQYFSDRIERITEFEILRDYRSGDLKIKFKFKSIYGSEVYYAN